MRQLTHRRVQEGAILTRELGPGVVIEMYITHTYQNQGTNVRDSQWRPVKIVEGPDANLDFWAHEMEGARRGRLHMGKVRFSYQELLHLDTNGYVGWRWPGEG